MSAILQIKVTDDGNGGQNIDFEVLAGLQSLDEHGTATDIMLITKHVIRQIIKSGYQAEIKISFDKDKSRWNFEESEGEDE